MSARSVFRSTLLISACTALSRVLGFAREMAMAYLFGTSLAKSAFDVAFRVPNLFRRLFGEGAMSAAFIPVFSATIEEEGAAGANRLANSMLTFLVVVLSLAAAVGIAAVSLAPAVLPLGERALAILPLLRIMLPYAVFICAAALCMAALNSLHHFAAPALAPLLLNVVWIGALFAVCPFLGSTPERQVVGLAWAITASGALQWAVQIPVLTHFGIRLRPSFNWRDPRVRSVLALMLPAALGMGVVQCNVVIDGLLALWVGRWAPAALTYAERLLYLPLGLIGTALGTVLLPTFSRQAAAGRHAEMAQTLAESVQNMLVLMIPIAVAMTLLARPMVDVAFAGGLFDAQSAAYTSRALMFYAPGLIPFSLYKVLVPAFYALKDTRTPVRIGASMVGLNIVLNIAFILTWPAGWEHAGLACATSLSSLLNVTILGVLLLRRIPGLRWRETAAVLVSIAAVAGVMAGCIAAVQPTVARVAAHLGMPEKLRQVLVLGITCAAGLAVYAAGAWMLCRDALLSALRPHSTASPLRADTI